MTGFYKADGGCDKVTYGTHYAKHLVEAGTEVVYYDEPKPKKLADDSVRNVILGYCIDDIELVTKAGPVVLTRSHIDILEGPKKVNPIYIGEPEEKRIKLRSYAEQIKDLVRRNSGGSTSKKPKAPDKNHEKRCCRLRFIKETN